MSLIERIDIIKKHIDIIKKLPKKCDKKIVCTFKFSDDHTRFFCVDCVCENEDKELRRSYDTVKTITLEHLTKKEKLVRRGVQQSIYDNKTIDMFRQHFVNKYISYRHFSNFANTEIMYFIKDEIRNHKIYLSYPYQFYLNGDVCSFTHTDNNVYSYIKNSNNITYTHPNKLFFITIEDCDDHLLYIDIIINYYYNNKTKKLKK